MSTNRHTDIKEISERIVDETFTDADITMMQIAVHLKEIKRIYDDFRLRHNIEDDYLDLTLINNKLSFCNAYYRIEDEEAKINFYEECEDE